MKRFFIFFLLLWWARSDSSSGPIVGKKSSASPRIRKTKSSPSGRTILEKFFDACREGDTSTIIEALDHGGIDCNVSDKSGMTGLHYASQQGKLEAVILLLQRKASAQVTENTYDWTPLYLAAENDRYPVCKVLVKAMLGPDVQDRGLWTPLHRAASKGFKEICSLLLRSGANKDSRSKSGYTPLSLAAFYGKKEIVELLLGHGADCTSQNNEGATALHFAASSGDLELCTILLDAGAFIDAQDVLGNTPLHDAAQGFRKEVCEMLVRRNANRFITSKEGLTALDFFLSLGNEELSHWAENILDRSSSTKKLIAAIEQKEEQLVKSYLKSGSFKVKELEDALPIAIKTGNAPIVGMLIGRGALSIEELQLFLFRHEVKKNGMNHVIPSHDT